MKAFFAALLFALCLNHSVAAAEIPDWIRSGLSAEPGEWAKRPAVVAYDSHGVSFSATGHIVDRRRTVLRFGTAAGFRYADLDFKYNPGSEKILTAKAWLIGKDGKVQRRFKRSDFTESFATYHSVMWDTQRVLYLNLSSQVTVGAYVAFEFEKESTDPTLETSHWVTRELPAHASTFEVSPPPNQTLQWYSTLSPALTPTSGDTPGSLRWTIGRTDKTPDDLPPESLPTVRAILVRCARPVGSEMDQSSWASLATAVSGVFAPATQPDDTVRAKATALTSGKTTRWERIRALCEFVQRDIRYIQITLDADYLAGIRPHRAPDVLKKRYGDCKDKAALLVSLLAVIGERSHMIVPNAGNPLAVVEAWPSANWFNHVIVGIVADNDTPPNWPISDVGALGKLVIFDPTDPVSPLGVLYSKDQGGFALLAAEKDGGLIKLPFDTPAQSTTKCQVTATLSSDLLLTVHLNTANQGTAGSESFGGRLFNGNVEYGRMLEKTLHNTMPRVNNFKWTDAWDSVVSRHTIDQHFDSPKYGKRLGVDRLIVQPRLLAPNFILPRLEITEGVIQFHARQIDERSSLKLPEGCTVTELPEPAKADRAHLSWDIACTSQNGELIYTAQIRQKSALADAKIYEEIRRERQELHDLLRRTATLTLAPKPIQPIAPKP